MKQQQEQKQIKQHSDDNMKPVYNIQWRLKLIWPETEVTINSRYTKLKACTGKREKHASGLNMIIMWRCARVTSPWVNLIIMNFYGVIYIGMKPQKWIIPSDKYEVMNST